MCDKDLRQIVCRNFFLIEDEAALSDSLISGSRILSELKDLFMDLGNVVALKGDQFRSSCLYCFKF